MGKITQHFAESEILDQDLVSVSSQPWRHGTRQTYVFEHDGKHWMFTADVHHDDGIQIYSDGVTCTQVHQVERVVKVWVPVSLDTVPGDMP